MGADNGKVSVRREGVTNQIKLFFWKYPNASAKKCCSELGLDYKQYRNLCYRIKSETRKAQQGKVQARQLVPLSHRVEFVLVDPLELGVFNAVNFEALRRKPRGDPYPIDDWFVVPNRNGMRMLRNEWVSVRVYPRSRRLFVLPHKPMDWKGVRVCLQNALFKAGLDLRECELLSEKLQPSDRHRTFYIGEVAPFKIDFYKPSLGITLKADGSHPQHIEVTEQYPSWIPILLQSQNKNVEALNNNTEVLGKYTEQVALHLNVLKGIGEAVDRFNEMIKTMPRTDELPNWLGDFFLRFDKLLASLENRDEKMDKVSEGMDGLKDGQDVLNKSLFYLSSRLARKRKRTAKPHPKPNRWQRLRRRLQK